MVWMTWRQHRWEVALGLAVLVAFGGGVLLLTLLGWHLMGQIAGACPSTTPNPAASIAACADSTAEYQNGFQVGWQWVLIVGTAIPALAGVFVGAPLVARELEKGTHLVAWSQSVPRRRWFLARVGLVAGGAAAGAALLAAIGQGWFAMQRGTGDGLGGPSLWAGFEIGPPVVIAYVLFALALGVAMGAAIRRTVPAMAATLVGFVVVTVAVGGFARPHYLAPLTSRQSILGSFSSLVPSGSAPTSGPGFNLSSDWLVNLGIGNYTNAAGHPVSDATVNELLGQCNIPNDGGATTCPAAANGITQLLSYQPASRFWLFQGIEAAIFLVLAGALLALAYRLVMRLR
ncbi:MAG: hypothetical protein ABR950_09060 [Candidatus Dormibacteria bacterium]|jgi:hypothetical protein